MRRLPRLEVLDLRFQRILDGKVSQFGALKNLRTLWLGWEYSPDEVARLREALPGCDLHVEVGTPPESAAPRRRGFVEYDRDGEDETWSIFQDLCGDLDTDDNHEAERLVKAVLKQQAPAVARRILFDSERDAFCAVARTEADLLLVADLIVALAGARQSFL